MHMRSCLLPICALLCLLFIPTLAAADPLVITSGSLTLGGSFPPGRGTFRSIAYNFAGQNFATQGSELDGSVQRVSSFCTGPVPCAAGTLVSGSSNPAMIGFASSNVPAGSFFPSLLTNSALTFITPDIAIPDSTLSTITLQTPFSLSGMLVVLGQINGQYTNVFSTMVTGQGIATLTLGRFAGPDGVFGYGLYAIRYDFGPAAVPEPTTLLLLGTSLAALAARKRRRQPVRR